MNRIPARLTNASVGGVKLAPSRRVSRMLTRSADTVKLGGFGNRRSRCHPDGRILVPRANPGICRHRTPATDTVRQHVTLPNEEQGGCTACVDSPNFSEPTDKKKGRSATTALYFRKLDIAFILRTSTADHVFTGRG